MRSITVRLPDELEKGLQIVAEGTDRSMSYVAVQALREYLAREVEFVQGVQTGIAQAARGEFASDEEMQALFTKYGLGRRGAQSESES